MLLPTLQEDLEEIEALVEVEQLQLLQHQQQQGNERPDVNILRSPGEVGGAGGVKDVGQWWVGQLSFIG